MPLTRANIYQSIWTKPLKQVASELQVSPAELAAECDRLDIPRPAKGYWKSSEAKRFQIGRPELPTKTFRADVQIFAGKPLGNSERQKRLRPEERKKQLHRIALKIIDEKGLAACTTTTLAHEAGVSEGLVSRYCGTRDQLLKELAVKEWRRQAKYWDEEQRKGKDLEDNVRRFVCAYLQSADEDGSALQQLLANPDVSRALERSVDATVDAVNINTAKQVAAGSRWGEEEAYWKTRALTASHRRAVLLISSNKGTRDQCIATTLSFAGIMP